MGRRLHVAGSPVPGDWLRQVPGPAVVLSSSGVVVRWNAAAAELMGWAAGPAARVLGGGPGWWRRLTDALEHAGGARLLVVTRRGRQRLPLELTAQALDYGHVLALLRDCTPELTRRRRARDERQQRYLAALRDTQAGLRAAEENLRRSEEQLRHSQKMDAIGRLAAGIAHDFNNLLTAIHGHAQFLIDDLPPALPSREDAVEIRRAADRATELTRQLLTFARRQPIEPVVVDVNGVVRSMDRMLRRLLGADITLVNELADVSPIYADPGQLEQVIVNLVVNAREAMPGGGTITIATRQVDLPERDDARDLAPGPYVVVEVTDTGTGMSEDVQRQVFDPFFTTKSGGTGLGLSTVYGTVKQNAGHISIESEPNAGTRVTVLLPVHGAASGTRAGERLAKRAATVLLVEDDPSVRLLAKRTLEVNGFHVIEAADGETGLQIAREQGAGIDVLVTDFTLPKLSGSDLAIQLRTEQPHMVVVLMSGYSETTLLQEGRIQRYRYFLEKPFPPLALVNAVRAAMQER